MLECCPGGLGGAERETELGFTDETGEDVEVSLG